MQWKHSILNHCRSLLNHSEYWRNSQSVAGYQNSECSTWCLYFVEVCMCLQFHGTESQRLSVEKKFYACWLATEWSLHTTRRIKQNAEVQQKISYSVILFTVVYMPNTFILYEKENSSSKLRFMRFQLQGMRTKQDSDGTKDDTVARLSGLYL